MKVFVTGATGVIGHRVIPKLIQTGHQVTGVARTDQKAVVLRRLGATPVQVDLFDAAALKPVMAGHEAVANLATNVPPLEQVMQPTAWDMHNRIRNEASVSLTRAAAEADIRSVVLLMMNIVCGQCRHIIRNLPPLNILQSLMLTVLCMLSVENLMMKL